MAPARRLLPFCLAVVWACSSARLAPARGPDPLLITEDEVVASLATTAYELIRALRPAFLSYRGETSFDRRTSRPYPTSMSTTRCSGRSPSCRAFRLPMSR